MKGAIDQSQGHVEDTREGIRATDMYQFSSFNHDDTRGGNFTCLGFLFSDALVWFLFSRFICIAFSQEFIRVVFTYFTGIFRNQVTNFSTCSLKSEF